LTFLEKSDLGTLIIVVVSLWFLWIQIRELRRSIQSSTYQNIYQMIVEIDRYFIENRDIKPYFYYNKEADSGQPHLREKLLSIAEMLIDCFDNIYHQKDCMPPSTFDPFSAFMKEIYQDSPILRELLSKREYWYPKRFVDHLKNSSRNVSSLLLY
jgi:hypothetical protein